MFVAKPAALARRLEPLENVNGVNAVRFDCDSYHAVNGVARLKQFQRPLLIQLTSDHSSLVTDHCPSASLDQIRRFANTDW